MAKLPESKLFESELPIGVFDSGVGGLSVLRHIRELMPAEELCYVADSAYAPYGEKTEQEVSTRVQLIADFLVRHPVKALVVACNTATATAVHQLREIFDIPVVGMEPGVKPAVEQSATGRIGVLATENTLRSKKFQSLLGRFDSNEVLLQSCSGLVEKIEQGLLTDPGTQALLEEYLLPLQEKSVDTLVLGCTHYPFVLPLIKNIVGKEVRVIDTGLAVAKELQRRLEKTSLLITVNVKSGQGKERFWSTACPKHSEKVMAAVWGSPVKVKELII